MENHDVVKYGVYSTILAIELGNNFVAASVADVTGFPTIKIIYYDSATTAALHDGMIVDSEELARVLSEIINRAQRVLGGDFNGAYVAMPPRSLHGTNISHTAPVPYSIITEELVQRVFEEAIERSYSVNEEVLHIIPGYFETESGPIVDELLVGRESSFLTANVHLVKAPKQQIDEVSNVLAAAGIHRASYISPAVAASEFAVTGGEKEVGCLFVYSRGRQSQVAAWSNGELVYSSTLNSGVDPLSRRVIGINRRDANILTARLRSHHPLIAPTSKEVLMEDLAASVKAAAVAIKGKINLNTTAIFGGDIGGVAHCLILGGDWSRIPAADTVFESIFSIPSRMSYAKASDSVGKIKYSGLNLLPPSSICLAGMFTVAIKDFIKAHSDSPMSEVWNSYL